jgi:hypothetical protein
MIQINLLDPTQARSRTRPAGGARKATGGGGGSAFGALLVMLTVALMVVLNVGVGWTFYCNVNKAGDEARRLRTEIKSVEDEIAKHKGDSDEVAQFEQVLRNQKEVLSTLDPPDRVLWCEKINMLSALVPRDVFLSDVEIKEVVKMVATEASRKAHAKWEELPKNKRGAEPEVVLHPVIHYDVTITGLATGRDSVEQFDNVLAFHKAMTGYQAANAQGGAIRFMDGFVDNVDFGLIEATTYEGVPVNKFVFKLRTESQGGEAPAAKTPTSLAEAKSRVQKVASAE